MKTVVLCFADIVGKPGRRAVQAALPELASTYRPDFIIGNVENLAGGRGINRKTLQEMLDLGFHAFTSGNHIWDNKEIYPILETESRVLRPANYPSPEGDPCPGRGFIELRSADKGLFLINLMGRVFMDFIDCPFREVDRILSTYQSDFPILVDMHADATSEKYAMGWFLAGRVSAVFGSHSHVQTADERIFPGGTAYITDIGMTGSFDSVIGLKPHEVIRKFMTRRKVQTQPAKENPGVSCVVITIGEDNKAENIERLRFIVPSKNIESEKDLE